MLKASYPEHDNEEEIDQAKFDEYLRLLKDIEDEENRQKSSQPLLRNSFDSDSYDSYSSDEDKLAKDQAEYAEYMRKLYDIDMDEYKNNEIQNNHFSRNLRSSQADDEIEGPIVSPFPFKKNDQPRLASSYDNLFDNTEYLGKRESSDKDAEYAEYMKRL